MADSSYAFGDMEKRKKLEKARRSPGNGKYSRRRQRRRGAHHTMNRASLQKLGRQSGEHRIFALNGGFLCDKVAPVNMAMVMLRGAAAGGRGRLAEVAGRCLGLSL